MENSSYALRGNVFKVVYTEPVGCRSLLMRRISEQCVVVGSKVLDFTLAVKRFRLAEPFTRPRVMCG
jgi:hypothetical protein